MMGLPRTNRQLNMYTTCYSFFRNDGATLAFLFNSLSIQLNNINNLDLL